MVKLSGALMLAGVPRLLREKGGHVPTAFPTISPQNNSSEPLFSSFTATEKWRRIEVPYVLEPLIELNLSYSICPTVCILFEQPFPSSLTFLPESQTFDPEQENCSQIITTPTLLTIPFPDHSITFSIRECCDGGVHEHSLCANKAPTSAASTNSFLDLGFVFVGLLCIDFGFVAYYFAYRRRIHPLFLCGYKWSDGNIRKCPHCQVQLTREDTSPCVHVICSSCNQGFDWSTAERPRQSWCLCFRGGNNRNATAPLRVEGRQQCFFCGVDQTPVSNDISPLEKWIYDNDEKRSQRSQSDDNEEDLRCPICLHNLKTLQLSCGHQFCRSCLVKCMKLKQQCPLDRIPIVDAPVAICITIQEDTVPQAEVVKDVGIQIA